MLFSEIYGKYYGAVTSILGAATEGVLTEAKILGFVREKAFAESLLTIPAALKNGDWPLLDANLHTPLKQAPVRPLTLLEKRWLKALLSDPRIRLFDPPLCGLDDVAPLYEPDVFVRYDQYADGDPYEDETYIAHFTAILSAFREKRKIQICFHSHRGIKHKWVCVPYGLEYSLKDDKFRLHLNSTRGNSLMVNIARIDACELLDVYTGDEYSPPTFRKEALTMELIDERNALERAMLHFSHLERETERIDENKYRITLHYDREDETEILIRILAFGPKLIVTSPDSFILLIRERLQKQRELCANGEFATFFP